MTSIELYQSLHEIVISYRAKVEPVGSRITCNPPPTDTDEDFLVLLPPDERTVSDFVASTGFLGFVCEGGEHYQQAASSFDNSVSVDGKKTMADTFLSMRRFDGDTNINLIITTSRDFFDRFMLATAVCKEVNILDKVHRKEVFHAIIYGCRLYRPEKDIADGMEA